MKLALGTVQFGMKYGAFNCEGQVSSDEVRAILGLAQRAGIDLLDTAHAYGSSEAVLGEAGAGNNFRLVTKIPPLNGVDPAAQVEAMFASSLERLQVGKVYGLMLHRAEDLAGAQGAAVWRALERLRDQGLVDRIGFSAYGPEEAMSLLRRFPVELIQVPLNVFDRRHLEAGTLAHCHQRGVEVHVRSVFLQGFALSEPEQLSAYLAQWRDVLAAFRGCAAELGLSPLQAALRFSLDAVGVERVVVGVDRAEQLAQILEAAKGDPLPMSAWTGLGSQDLGLIEPSRWN